MRAIPRESARGIVGQRTSARRFQHRRATRRRSASVRPDRAMVGPDRLCPVHLPCSMPVAEGDALQRPSPRAPAGHDLLSTTTDRGRCPDLLDQPVGGPRSHRRREEMVWIDRQVQTGGSRAASGGVIDGPWPRRSPDHEHVQVLRRRPRPCPDSGASPTIHRSARDRPWSISSNSSPVTVIGPICGGQELGQTGRASRLLYVAGEETAHEPTERLRRISASTQRLDVSLDR